MTNLDPNRFIPEQLTPEKCTALAKEYMYGDLHKQDDSPCFLLTEPHEMSALMEERTEARTYKTIAH